MKNSKTCRLRGIPALMAMLFGLMVTVLLLPAYAQQEVSPAWFDPWVPASTAAAQPAKTAVAAQKPARTLKAASSATSAKSAQRVRRAEKLRAKRSTSRPTAS